MEPPRLGAASDDGGAASGLQSLQSDIEVRGGGCGGCDVGAMATAFYAFIFWHA